MRSAFEALFWIAVALIAWTQLGYALCIALIARVLAPGAVAQAPGAVGADTARQTQTHPSVSLIVAAHNEQGVIAAKVLNVLALEYPRELLEVIVACDGCSDATAARASEAGADLVLELPRGGKIAAQDAAVQRSRGEIVAFSDANALWAPDALAELVAAFADARVGYVCGRVRFLRDGLMPDGAGATNQEGVYWGYEMSLRARESRLASITAGNGAIYATRRESYIVVDPVMGHDLSFPFNMVKRGWRAVEAPRARASEKMVPSIEGEFSRKRRMMSHTWPIVVCGGMLSPRGYPLGYALMIFSHRLLRYLLPFLHLLALACNVALVALGDGDGLYVVALALQLALLVAAALARFAPARPLLIARYYVWTAASPAAGLWDWLRHGTEASWQAAEGTR
jgi:cellulose synthase/poly-beta-1,6-N-acetylglucosamine synthase-like glycosyltransferase